MLKVQKDILMDYLDHIFNKYILKNCYMYNMKSVCFKVPYFVISCEFFL